jgi:hypothetical protein
VKSATATTPFRRESTKPKSVSEPQANARPADKRPESTTQSTKPSHSPSSVLEFEPTIVDEEQIRRRAYELYVEDGYQDGNQLEHWLAAERELRGKIKRQT